MFLETFTSILGFLHTFGLLGVQLKLWKGTFEQAGQEQWLIRACNNSKEGNCGLLWI